MTGNPSVLAPVSKALDWTGKVLFRPFEIEKWLVLGFCAWLAWLGEHSFRNGNWDRGFDEDFRDDYHGASGWILDNLAFVMTVVLLVMVVGFAVWLLFLWLSSRGKFMFLDGVLHDRAAVKEPWNRFGTAANALFVLRAVVAVGMFVVFVGLTVLFLVAVLPIDADEIGPAVVLPLVFWIATMLVLGFAGALFAMTVTDFIVPIMWIRGCTVKAAFQECGALVSANAGSFLLYVLFKILLAILYLVIGCIATCITCCLAAVPYIGTVILLPLFVFHRTYSSYFLAQLDTDYAALAPSLDSPAASS
jgi:hypothetical protein